MLIYMISKDNSVCIRICTLNTALLGLLLNGDNVARYPFTLREPLILSTTHKLTANVFTH